MPPSNSQIESAFFAAATDMSTMVPDIKTLIYGDTGQGKTVLGMQILQKYTPPDKQIYFIDTARGWVSLRNHPGLRERTTRFPYLGMSQIDAFVAMYEKGDPRVANVGAVQIDEISSVQEIDVEVVRQGRGESTGEFAAPTQPDMGVTTRRLQRTILPLLRLPINVILISHMRDDEIKIGNKATGRYMTRPAMMPTASRLIRGQVHDVLYMSTAMQGDNHIRLLQVHPTKSINAKTRVGDLPPQVSPAKFVGALGEWLNGDRPDAPAALSDSEVEAESDFDSVALEVKE